MKKSTIIAAAIAATISGSAFAADTTLYGNIRLGIENQAELDMNSGKLVIGFKSSEDMGNGMTGFMHLEMEHDRADIEGAGLGWTNDRSYVGVKGDFGQIALGTQGDAAGFACGGTDVFTYNSGSACGVGAVNGNLSNAATYVKGFGDVTLVVGLTIDGSADGTKPANGDHKLIAVNYASGAIQVGAQIIMPDSEIVVRSEDPVTGVVTESIAKDVTNHMALGGTYTINDIVIGLTYTSGNTFAGSIKAGNGLDDAETALALAVQFPVAGGKVKVGMDTGEDAGVADTTNVEFAKNISKSVYTGVQYSSVDGVDDDLIAVYLGMKF